MRNAPGSRRKQTAGLASNFSGGGGERNVVVAFEDMEEVYARLLRVCFMRKCREIERDVTH